MTTKMGKRTKTKSTEPRDQKDVSPEHAETTPHHPRKAPASQLRRLDRHYFYLGLCDGMSASGEPWTDLLRSEFVGGDAVKINDGGTRAVLHLAGVACADWENLSPMEREQAKGFADAILELLNALHRLSDPKAPSGRPQALRLLRAVAKTVLADFGNPSGFHDAQHVPDAHRHAKLAQREILPILKEACSRIRGSARPPDPAFLSDVATRVNAVFQFGLDEAMFAPCCTLPDIESLKTKDPLDVFHRLLKRLHFPLSREDLSRSHARRR